MKITSLPKKILFFLKKKNKFLYFFNLILNIFSKNKYYSSNRIFNLMNKKNGKDLNFFIKEIIEDDYLKETWNKHKNTLGPSKYFSWESSIYKRIGQVLIFYALIRILRPKNVVETGTASGSMTSFILAALNKNKFGKCKKKLHLSVDFIRPIYKIITNSQKFNSNTIKVLSKIAEILHKYDNITNVSFLSDLNKLLLICMNDNISTFTNIKPNTIINKKPYII